MNKWKMMFAQSGFNTGIQDGENFPSVTNNNITQQTEPTRCYLFFTLNSSRSTVGLYKSILNETQLFILSTSQNWRILLSMKQGTGWRSCMLPWALSASSSDPLQQQGWELLQASRSSSEHKDSSPRAREQECHSTPASEGCQLLPRGTAFPEMN